MTMIGRATKAMFEYIAEDTWGRAIKWFKENPKAKFAYWGKDEFLPDYVTADERKAFMDRHPEVVDLEDHTTVYILNDSLIFATFCPRLKAGVKEIYDDGITELDCDSVHLHIEPDLDNYRMIMTK